MSSFTSPPQIKQIGVYLWEVLQPFEYHVGIYPSPYVVQVPAGFKTDLASIPAPFNLVLKRDDPRWAKAAIVHDYLYDQAIGEKADADLIFLSAMVVTGTPLWLAVIMYVAVCQYGRGNFGKTGHFK